MLAIGASIGGLVTAVAGRNVAFVVNAASFFCVGVLHRADAIRRDAGRPRDRRVRGFARADRRHRSDRRLALRPRRSRTSRR